MYISEDINVLEKITLITTMRGLFKDQTKNYTQISKSTYCLYQRHDTTGKRPQINKYRGPVIKIY